MCLLHQPPVAPWGKHWPAKVRDKCLSLFTCKEWLLGPHLIQNPAVSQGSQCHADSTLDSLAVILGPRDGALQDKSTCLWRRRRRNLEYGLCQREMVGGRIAGAIHFFILPLVSLVRPEQSPVHLCLGPAKSMPADIDFLSSCFTGAEKPLVGREAGFWQRPSQAGVTWPWIPHGTKYQQQMTLLNGNS